MTGLAFLQSQIPVTGGHLGAWSIGKGPGVIFLHGGPGDTHDYMKRMAEPLFRDFQCVFFDQRGTGKSNDFTRIPDQFSLPVLLSDILAVRDHFRLVDVALVGHSWGALYGLFACIQHPDQFRRAALISMGPLDDEMNRATADHLLSVLTDSEKTSWQQLRASRNQARDRGDLDAVKNADKKMMDLRVKAWVFNEGLRSEFLEEYFRDPPPDREVNKLIWESAQSWFSWERLKAIKSDLWLCIGANDSVPISQTNRVVERVPRACATILERCGHIPWLEHPVTFYQGLKTFLAGGNPHFE